MTKRAFGKFERRDRNFYATPEAAILKLLPHLAHVDRFGEPMCGDGAIVHVLERLGWSCRFACDLVPEGYMIRRAQSRDAMELTEEDFTECEVIISNPPWPAPVRVQAGTVPGHPTVPIIQHIMRIRPTWLLLSADFAHNMYFTSLAKHCKKIVSTGRVKWITGSKSTGFDNAAWYLFDGKKEVEGPVFYSNIPGVKIFNSTVENLL